MKDQIIAAIAEYLEQELRPYSTGLVLYGSYEFKARGETSRELMPKFCQEIAAEIAAEIAEKVLSVAGEKDMPYDELFDHMANEHGLTLIQSELGDIIHIARGK